MQPGICGKCGGALRPGAQFCPACGSKVQMETVGKSPNKLWKTLGTVGIIVGVAAVLVLVGSVVLSSLGLSGPGTKTAAAMVKGAAAGSFAVEAEGRIGNADLELELES